MKPIRTDLAVEICDHAKEHNPNLRGIECSSTLCGKMKLEEVHVQTEEGARLLGKPQGSYLTLNTGKLWLDDRELFREKLMAFRSLLTDFFKGRVSAGASVLVAGLGNRSITADAIGPEVTENLLITRHIRSERPLVFEELGLCELCAVTPGVLGQTGIESADVVQSICKSVRPAAVIAIDALAGRDLNRLVTTIQLCDTGISPGSGIGNSRPALTPKELGIPVLTVGVPTVVDAATLAADAVHRFSDGEADSEIIRKEWSESDLNFFVTPKETDRVIHVMGAFIGYGINLALNPELSYEDMLSLVG